MQYAMTLDLGGYLARFHSSFVRPLRDEWAGVICYVALRQMSSVKDDSMNITKFLN